ncbi:hypothetical protein P0G09_18990, partial [Faecalibacterium sp. DFI.5.82]|nr:hypothetical protein [Faecalibacterium sp. DFI.5.82]
PPQFAPARQAETSSIRGSSSTAMNFAASTRTTAPIAEQRNFNLRLQANNVNFDQYLKVRGQTVEQFRTELHAQAEQIFPAICTTARVLWKP